MSLTKNKNSYAISLAPFKNFVVMVYLYIITDCHEYGRYYTHINFHISRFLEMGAN